MRYHSSLNVRRILSVTLLAIIAVPLLGGMAFASICLEPCADDTEKTSCPPVCSLCPSCTHAHTGIVRNAVGSAPFTSGGGLVPQQPATASSQLAAEIFHVPLFG